MKKIGTLVGLWAVGLVLAATSAAPAQRRPAFEQVVQKVSASVEPAEAKPGQVVTLKVTAGLIDGWHTYPTRQPDPAAKSYVNAFVPPPAYPHPDLILVGSAEDPAGFVAKPEPKLDIGELRYYLGTATWVHKAVVSPEATPGKKTFRFKFRMLACDEQGCLPPRPVPLEVQINVLPDKAEVPAEYKAAVATALAAQPPPPKAGPKPDSEPRTAQAPGSKGEAPRLLATDDPAQHEADLKAVLAQLPPAKDLLTETPASTGLFSFLVTAAFWGLISLVTPCVFPMIPITISFFLKQGHHSRRRTVGLASVYCLTIIIVLGISALTLLSFFRALSVNPWMNIGLGLLFVFFALSLFGMYDITLPGWLSNFTAKREKGGGLVGTVFMALTFTIISFTCVAPFLGGFSGMAASGQFRLWELALGGFTFAAAFALPFFVLALFPSLLKKMPKAGSWMNGVKVVMGFLELAAALKFFRTAELRLLPEPEFFTYDLVLGMWVAIAFLAGLYLLHVYRLPHDEPQEHIGVSRMLVGFVFLSLGLYLLPALFRGGPEGEKQRPGGAVYAWVDAFLLPEPGPGEFPWNANLKEAVDHARAERARTGKPQYVFVDFTGVTCTNCKYNEKQIFSRGTIKGLFKPFTLVQMYTDEIPESFYASPPPNDVRNAEALANLAFQQEAFGTQQLPLYVILEPLPGDRIDVVGVYSEGKINREDKFAAFLRKPFEQNTAQARANRPEPPARVPTPAPEKKEPPKPEPKQTPKESPKEPQPSPAKGEPERFLQAPESEWPMPLKQAVAEARKGQAKPDGQKLVFLDFTGVTCVPCRINEAKVFPLPEVKALFKNYHKAELYTDEVPAEKYATPPPDEQREADALQNLQFQKKAFGSSAVPLYVTLQPLPDGRVKVVGTFGGKIEDPSKFADFLKKPLGK